MIEVAFGDANFDGRFNSEDLVVIFEVDCYSTMTSAVRLRRPADDFRYACLAVQLPGRKTVRT